MAQKKKKKLITYQVSVFNVHIKGPRKNKGFSELFESIEKRLLKGSLKVEPDKFGTVLRSLSGTKREKHTTLSILKYNEKKTGLAWDIEKEELIKNTTQVTAQVTNAVIYPDMHIVALIHKSHGPTVTEMEGYLKKVFLSAAKEKDEDYDVDVLSFKQRGAVDKIEEWDKLISLHIEVYKNNPHPINEEVGNRLDELVEITNSDKLIIDLINRHADGLNKEELKPILAGGDLLVENSRARIKAKGEIDGDKDFIDTDEAKVGKFPVKSYADDEGGLPQKIIESIRKFLNVG